MAVIKDIEIFRAGNWNGDDYTERDLDAMVDAFDVVGFKPPVKVGHAEKSGDPAFGWVAGIRRVGDRLIATLKDIPDQLFEMIRQRRYDSVSSEVYWNLNRNGVTYPRVLKAVALLGAEVPAVSDLAPLRDAIVV